MQAVLDALCTDGFTALEGAFPREWVVQMREDLDAAFADACWSRLRELNACLRS